MSYVKKYRPHEYILWQGKNEPILGQIDIELTERCNNKCIHCCINRPEDDVEAQSREMSTDFIKTILTEAAGLGCFSVRFTGGEPLLRDDFEEIYLFARRLGMKVILFTNARLINKKLADLLARIPPGHLVEVSVYGMNDESYDRVAGKRGAFSEFWSGVQLLLEYKIPFLVKGAKLDILKEEQKEFEAWASTIPSMNKAPSYSMNYEFRHRHDDPAKNVYIATLRATPEETVASISRESIFQREMVRFCSQFMGLPGDKLFNCGAGYGTCIDAYGNAQLCLPMRSPECVVNLHDMTIKEVLEEKFTVMRELRAKNAEYLRRCARCFLKGLCGQCPAKSWLEYGTLDTPVEYLCEVAHAKARFIGIVRENEKAWEIDDWQERVTAFVNVHRLDESIV
ncbi:MAG TPA: radical SAM protein [Negativicutes bacterium]|nr:radical SAM protein [Negativicutes bacterium]